MRLLLQDGGFVQPIQQRQISRFTPLPTQEVFGSLDVLQGRQDQALAELDALDAFERDAQILDQDRPLLNQTIAGVRDKIGEIADQGFVGNRLRGIRKLAHDFRQQFTPFVEQRQAVQNVQKALREDTSLTEYDRQRRISSVQRNLGLQLNPETGRIADESVFRGRTFASRPDLDQLVRDQLKEMDTSRVEGLPTQIGSQMVTQANEYRDPRTIRAVARSVVFNNPEALAFLRDEVSLAKEEKNAQGLEFTAEDEQKVINDLVERTVNNAVGTFQVNRVSTQFKNAPDLGSSASGDKVQFIRQAGNVTMSTRMADLPAKTQAMRETVQNNRAILQSSEVNMSEAERVGLEARTKAMEQELQENEAYLNRIRKEENISAEFVNNVKVQEPAPPADLDPARAALIQQTARDRSGFFATIEDATINAPSAQRGFIGPGGAGLTLGAAPRNQAPQGTDFNADESNYYNDYKSWYQSLTAAQKDENGRLEAALERRQNDMFESTVSTAISLPEGAGTANLAKKLKTALNVSQPRVGFNITGANREALGEDELPTEITIVGDVTTVPANQGMFELFVKGKDNNDQEHNYIVQVDPNSNRDMLQILGTELVKGAGNDEVGRRQMATGLNMLYPEMSQALINQPPQSVRSNYGLLGPDDFKFTIGGKEVQLGLERNPDGSFVLVDENGTPAKSASGQPFVFTGLSDANVRLLAPMLQKKLEANAGSQ